MPTQSDIHRLVSLTFDEDPKVRKDAARGLSKMDDPAALFALMELNYDKDAGVKKVAQQILQEKKAGAQEVMSFAEMFSAGRREEAVVVEGEDSEQRKERVLSPITQLFEKSLGKERAEAVRHRMMPTIEKLYRKSTDAPVHTRDNERERKVIQEFLTSYLEAISTIDSLGSGGTLQVQEIPHEGMEEELEEVGHPREVEKIEREMVLLETEQGEEEQEETALRELPETLFKKAYETMMLSGGDDKVMRREMRRMMRDLERDVKLAFHLARKRFRETKIMHLTKLRDGMRNVNSEVLQVRQMEKIQYPKGKQMYLLTRLVLLDDAENEAVLYLFDNRGGEIREGMRIKLVRGQVKTFVFSGETALTLGKKSQVYIVI